MNFIERIGKKQKSKKQSVQYKALNPNFTPKILEVKQNSNTESTTLYGDRNPKPSLLNRKTKFNWKTNFKTNSFPFKLYSFFEKSLTFTNYTLKNKLHFVFFKNIIRTFLIMTTPQLPPTSSPHIQLKTFGGTPKENWNQFDSRFRASLAVAKTRTADSQQRQYLHLHLCGTALSFYLGLTQSQQDDIEESLRCLRNRYAVADKRRNFEFEQINRKFDPAKEDADDFFDRFAEVG